MDALVEKWPMIWPFIAAGVAAVGVLLACGCFRRGVFDQSQARLELTLFDVAIGFCLMFMGIIALGTVVQQFNLPVTATDPGTPVERAFVPLLSQLLTQFPIVVFLIWRGFQTPDGVAQLGILPRRPGRELLAGFLAIFAALPIVFGINAVAMAVSLLWGEKPPEIAHDLLKQLIENKDAIAGLMLIGSAVLLAPLFEEFIFRGLLQTFFVSITGSASRWLAILATSFVFALIHIKAANWQVLPGLFCLSLMLGWLYEKHGSLLPCVVLHALFNAANVALGFAQLKQDAPAQ